MCNPVLRRPPKAILSPLQLFATQHARNPPVPASELGRRHPAQKIDASRLRPLLHLYPQQALDTAHTAHAARHLPPRALSRDALCDDVAECLHPQSKSCLPVLDCFLPPKIHCTRIRSSSPPLQPKWRGK